MSILINMLIFIATTVLMALLKYQYPKVKWSGWILGITLLFQFILINIIFTITTPLTLNILNIIKDILSFIICLILMPVEKIPNCLSKCKPFKNDRYI